MPQASDSNYAAVTRHRRPFVTSSYARAAFLIEGECLDGISALDNPIPTHGFTPEEGACSFLSNAWTSDQLEDDDIPVARHESVVAPLLEEGELDADAIVVSPTGNSSVAANNATERRRRDEGWADLGLERFTAPLARLSSRANSNSGNNRDQSGSRGGSDTGGTPTS